jgi:UDP-N-acetylmuramate--alanine ligase
MPADARDDALSLDRPCRVHVVGIGGAGMSGLARLLVGLGHRVSGSDLADSSTTAGLRALGIEVAVGHAAANVGDVDLVTASPAVAPDNPELVAATARGIRVATRAEVLGAVGALRETLAVAGTHGKTTTSSMLAVVLAAAERSPSWLLGADVVGLGPNAHLGEGAELVLEADESYGTFERLAPTLCAVTNVEPDHLDHYGSLDALHDAFGRLLGRAGAAVVNADDPVAAALGARVGATRVGTDPACELVVEAVQLERASSRFTLRHEGSTLELVVGAPGPHNVQNAAVAAAVAVLRGVADEAVVEGLGRFAGSPRRFERRGEVHGATLVDDYAHLPGEVRSALATARAGGWRRVVAVFQPHRYTRTQALARDFAHAFDGADVVVVTDVYGAGEPPLPGVTGRLVADAVAQAPGAPDVRYVADRVDVAAAVASILDDGDLVLTMGAGDLTTLPDELLEVLR